MPDFIRSPLKGMGTWLGRLVLRTARVTLLSVIAAFVLFVLDALLLRDVRRETT